MMVFDVKKSTRERKLATLAEVAALAGVSTATADRVLNRRPGVRGSTAQRVLKAAAELDYLPEADLYAAMAPEPMRLVILLPRGSNRFLRMLGDSVSYAHEHFAPLNARCQVDYVESFNPEALAQTLLHHGKRADGIAFMALEHPVVREAVNALAQQGVPTVTLISDLANSARVAYVGLDNRAAGRTAGYLLARFIGPRAAHVALIAGSRHYRAHEEREGGFLQLYAEQFQAMQVVDLREGYDDAQRNYEQTRQLLEQYPQLAGIYNIGGASDGVARAQGGRPAASRGVHRPRPDAGHARAADRRHHGRRHHAEPGRGADELRAHLLQRARQAQPHERGGDEPQPGDPAREPAIARHITCCTGLPVTASRRGGEPTPARTPT